MTIERRETRFIIPADVAPSANDDIEMTSPHAHLRGRNATRVRPPRFAPTEDIDPFAPRPDNATATTGSIGLPPLRRPSAPTHKPASQRHTAVPMQAEAIATASPRATPVLERRRLWERRYRMRLRLTDVALIVLLTFGPRLAELALAGQLPLVAGTGGVIAAFAIPLLVAVTWFTALSVFRSREAAIFGTGSAEYRRVLHATAFTFGTVAILFSVLELTGLRTELLVTLPAGVVLLLLGRWSWRRWLLRERLFGHYVARTMIVGDRADVEYVIETLHRDGQRGYLVVGATLTGEEDGDLRVDGMSYPVVGTPRTAARTAERLGADTIIVAGHDDADPYFVKRLSWQLEGTAAELVLSSRLTDVAGPRISLRPLDGMPLIGVKIPSFDGAQYALKRTLDIVVSSIALIAIGIVAVPLSLAIKLDSRGPVFFRQERVGRDGHRFRMVKFRTMRVGAEAEVAALAAANDGAGPLFKLRHDPRVTRLGAILRRLSLDELPQFWNVLRGDMSVVGPRPPLPSEVTAYNGAVYRRLYIKPGITGLWQVSGRSDLPWDESVRLDLRYVENWSIVSDLSIMWRTVRTMIAPRGAY